MAVVEEVERLPDKFRLPVLLCYFEDCTHAEAGMATTPTAVPAGSSELSREVVLAMANTNAKWTAGAALAALLLTGGLGLIALTAGPTREEPKPAVKPSAKVPDKTDDAELKPLQGTWWVTKIENNRGVAEAKVIEPMRWEIVGSTVTYIHRPDSKQRDKSRIVLDGTKSPKRIAQTALTGSSFGPGRKIEGIYEVKGDTLRICFGEEGKEFPTEFKVEKGADMGLIELERIPDTIRSLKDLAGEWQFLHDGKPQDSGPMEIYRDMSWMTSGDKTERAIVVLDAEKGYFDFLSTTGGKPQLGRFIWKDNKMTMYFGAPGAERPAEANASKGVTVAVMERIKKK